MLEYINLGRVLEAHDSRHYFRKKLSENHKSVSVAKSDVAMFGMYDDCGDSYEDEYTSAKRAYEEALKRKISSEKHFKALKMQFIEKHPELERTMNEMLDEQSRRHNKA